MLSDFQRTINWRGFYFYGVKAARMLKNYLKTAWRSLTANKTYSVINITGLAIGLAACMLIMLYAAHEWSYNRFHNNANRIYWMQAKLKLGNDSLFMPYLGYSTGLEVKNRTSAVESVLRIKQPDRDAVVQNLQAPSLKFTENKFLFADSNFFNFFSFQLKSGNKNLVLQNPFSVVLSQHAATKYFGKEHPIGKVIRLNNEYDFVVSGVAENAPSNSSITYDFVAPISSLLAMSGQKELVTQDENIFSTYFLLKHPSNVAQLETSLQLLSKAQNPGDEHGRRYMTLPLKNIHEYADMDKSNRKYLDLFPLIAGLILLLAVFNYISLTTARSSVRSKEVGVRKVLGASKKNLTVQFFVESALCTAVAFSFGYLLCLLLQPFFFGFLQIPVNNSFLYQPTMIVAFATLFVITLLLSAIYPSVLLSAFRPALVLYGKLSRQSGGISIRKFFTVFQFTIAVILVIGAVIIQRQIYYIRHTDTGVQRDNVVMVPFGANVGDNYTAFKRDIQSLASVEKASVALHPLYQGFDMMAVKPKGTDQMILLPTLMADQHFISLLNLKWKTVPEDSNFTLKRKNLVVLNETAVEKLNLGFQPINQKIDDQFEVVGVLKDFNYASLQNKIEPVCLFIIPDSDTSALWAHQGGCLYAKVSPGTNTPSLVNQLQNIYAKYDKEKPFEFRLMDDVYDAQYKAEDRLSKILNMFTFFAMLIASLGLFGLATFMALQRTKEIGVRKVLGATVQNIVALLSKDFLKLVILAIVIAAPIAWWAADSWLQNFVYRIKIEWWMFVGTALMVTAIALLTVSYQAIKVAFTNPAKSIRTE